MSYHGRSGWTRKFNNCFGHVGSSFTSEQGPQFRAYGPSPSQPAAVPGRVPVWRSGHSHESSPAEPISVDPTLPDSDASAASLTQEPTTSRGSLRKTVNFESDRPGPLRIWRESPGSLMWSSRGTNMICASLLLWIQKVLISSDCKFDSEGRTGTKPHRIECTTFEFPADVQHKSSSSAAE
jgi:hypothetical protein